MKAFSIPPFFIATYKLLIIPECYSGR